MRVLENCEPKRVFYYFEEICKIPHGSGNTKQISDYLVDFAKKQDRKSTRLNSSHIEESRMPSSA